MCIYITQQLLSVRLLLFGGKDNVFFGLSRLIRGDIEQDQYHYKNSPAT